MPHPASVRIGVIEYAVKSDLETFNAVLAEKGEGSNFYGFSNHQKAIIALKPRMAPAVERLTLWHEILHACMEVLAGAPDWSESWLGDEREERAIRAFEHPTLQVLVDNPELRDYLFEPHLAAR